MVGANLKAETMAMMESRTAVEAEMDAIIARLSRPGGAGLQGNLVDSEGFPRADLDIAAVRADRQRLSVLRNDHKELTSSIERNIYILHSGGFTKDSALPQKRTGVHYLIV
jgi:26S proteasome non-ATPase regulatory subunit 9